MNLDEGQTTRVRQWIEEGLSAAAIQTRLQEELGLKMTYAEVRFLLGDLQLRPKDVPKPATPILGAGGGSAPAAASAAPNSKSKSPSPAGPAAGSGLKTAPLGGEAPSGGRVAVNVDQIARPGMVVSGKVTFSDGQTAEWGIDQMGRPMLMPQQPGYRPSQADVLDFQTELDQVLSRMGY